MSTINCPKCNTEFDNYSKYGLKKFCSRKCANSRGPRTEEFKQLVRKKQTGKKMPIDGVIKAILTKGQILHKHSLVNTVCIVCNKDTGNKYRKTCSDECYRLNCKLSSQKNPNCGGQKHTHRSKISNINGDIFVAESSFEVTLAKSLNDNNILWIRPNGVTYIDGKGHSRRYYPDFFLPEFSVYLDPKNDYLIKTDIEKILFVANQNHIKIIILGKKYLNYDTFKHLVSPDGNAPPYPTCKEGVLLLN